MAPDRPPLTLFLFVEACVDELLYFHCSGPLGFHSVSVQRYTFIQELEIEHSCSVVYGYVAWKTGKSRVLIPGLFD